MTIMSPWLLIHLVFMCVCVFVCMHMCLCVLASVQSLTSKCCVRIWLLTLFWTLKDFLGQTFCTLGEIIGSIGGRLERTLSWVQNSGSAWMFVSFLRCQILNGCCWPTGRATTTGGRLHALRGKIWGSFRDSREILGSFRGSMSFKRRSDAHLETPERS